MLLINFPIGSHLQENFLFNDYSSSALRPSAGCPSWVVPYPSEIALSGADGPPHATKANDKRIAAKIDVSFICY